MRIAPPAGASAAAGAAGHAAPGRVSGARAPAGTAGGAPRQEAAPRQPRAAAAAGPGVGAGWRGVGVALPPPRTRQRAGGARRARHFLFGARRLPPPRAPGPAPAPLSARRRRARGGAERRAAPLCPQGRASRARTCARRRGAAQLRAAPRLRLLFPWSLPPSLAREDGPRSRLRLAYSAAEDGIYIRAQARPSFRFGTGTGGSFSKSLLLIAPALQITSGDLWEEPTGVEDVASLCKRKKTLSPSWRPLPRVTRREAGARTACGFDLASVEPVGGRGHELGVRTGRHPSWAPGGGPRYLLHPPRGSPHAVSSGGRTVITSTRLQADSRGRTREEGTVFQERVTRN